MDGPLEAFKSFLCRHNLESCMKRKSETSRIPIAPPRNLNTAPIGYATNESQDRSISCLILRKVQTAVGINSNSKIAATNAESDTFCCFRILVTPHGTNPRLLQSYHGLQYMGAIYQRRQSGLKPGVSWLRVKKIRFSRQIFEKFQFFQAISQKILFFPSKFSKNFNFFKQFHKKFDFSRQISEKFQCFQAVSQTILNFQAKIGYLQLLLGKLFYFSSKVTIFEYTSCTS